MTVLHSVLGILYIQEKEKKQDIYEVQELPAKCGS